MQFRVTFKGFEIVSQTIQSTGHSQDHLVARVYFDLVVNGREYTDACIECRQPFGTDYSVEPIEVRLAPESSYNGPFPLNTFSGELDRYYRAHVGGSGRLIKYGLGMEINIEEAVMSSADGPHDLELDDVAGGWTLTHDFVRMPTPPPGQQRTSPIPKLNREFRIRSLASRPTGQPEPPLIVHDDETFMNQTVVLDGHAFNNCKFVSCVIVYNGTHVTQMVNPSFFEENKWSLEGPAKRTLQFLQALHTEGGYMKDMVDLLVNKIRSGVNDI
jgi:hypothetical protein